MAPTLTYHPVKGLGTSGAGAACVFARSPARTAAKDDAKTAQVETQARIKLFGRFGPTIKSSPTPVGMALRSHGRERRTK